MNREETLQKSFDQAKAVFLFGAAMAAAGAVGIVVLTLSPLLAPLVFARTWAGKKPPFTIDKDEEKILGVYPSENLKGIFWRAAPGEEGKEALNEKD